MSLDISVKTEARLPTKAREQDLSIDAYLERLLNDTGDEEACAANGGTVELPVWNLGLSGGLHRRDIAG